MTTRAAASNRTKAELIAALAPSDDATARRLHRMTVTELAGMLAAQEAEASSVAHVANAQPLSAPDADTRPMTKTQAYEWVKRSRDGLRDADHQIHKGTAKDLRAALLETIGAATHPLDALDSDGIVVGVAR